MRETTTLPLHRFILVLEPLTIAIIGTALWWFMLGRYGLDLPFDPQLISHSSGPASQNIIWPWQIIIIGLLPLTLAAVIVINIVDPLATVYRLTDGGLEIVTGRWFGHQKPRLVPYGDIRGVVVSAPPIWGMNVADLYLQVVGGNFRLRAVKKPKTAAEEIRRRMIAALTPNGAIS
ncbi:MAG: PH domain-containing protein [Candidatus Kerfeldbacteria bacterium]|nr:PH domain-containing protein [Candidatus Kerfeldbacteria bacterium]